MIHFNEGYGLRSCTFEHSDSASENILVYGDYDVDGTTAVSLMYSFIKSIHYNVEYYIPDRYYEGFGVSFQ